MATFGIKHTLNSPVGGDYTRGVSGGERKRVSIAEAALSKAPLQCWDNSTRGLDSANAIEFCKTLRTETEVFKSQARFPNLGNLLVFGVRLPLRHLPLPIVPRLSIRTPFIL
jgi:hypothetical protein